MYIIESEIFCTSNLDYYNKLSENFCYRNGRLFIWDCTIEPDDLVKWEPPLKKGKIENSDSEDDIDVEKVVERTEKQKAFAESKLLDSGKIVFYIFFLLNFNQELFTRRRLLEYFLSLIR